MTNEEVRPEEAQTEDAAKTREEQIKVSVQDKKL